MSRSHLTATIAVLSFGLAAPALANDLYPRTVGTGEDIEVDYGLNGPGNIVGGGRVVVTGSGEDLQLRHLDPEFTQAPPSGLVPVTVDSDEGSTTVWVPAGTDHSRLALIGADGSLPAAKGVGSAFHAGLPGRPGGRG
jgi:hypothetical protein